MSAHDVKYMQRCLDLARKGAGLVSPNPMVGCVIVKGGRRIAEGFHRKYGEDHAEQRALRNARTSPEGATLYVNLEPCSHYGKTPPCADAIIRAGIVRVVIGMRDPNPVVAGRGIALLRGAGIVVDEGILGDACRDLNRFFIKYITTRMPYVLVKIAQSVDGYIAGGDRNEWITGKQSRSMVHEWRSRYDAVLVGAGTVRTDNPLLTVRHVGGRNPLRVVVDGGMNSNPRAHVFSDRNAHETLLIVEERVYYRKHTARAEFERKRCTVVTIRGKAPGVLSFSEVFRALGLMGIASVLVEGGAEVFRKVLEEKLADELAVFISPRPLHRGLKVFGNPGTSGEPLRYNLLAPTVQEIGGDRLIRGMIGY